jgi:uncharacterized protein (TIGR02145 family)
MKIRSCVSSIIFWLFILLFQFNLYANVTISGTVTDTSGTAIDNAKILIIYQNDTTKVYTSEDGSYSGEIILTGINSDKPNGVLDNYLMSQNYPNPFNPSTTINVNQKGTLRIFNLLGQMVVETKIAEQLHSIKKKLPSGIYFYQLIADKSQKSQVHKMVLIDGGLTTFNIKLNESLKEISFKINNSNTKDDEIKLVFSHPRHYPITDSIDFMDETPVLYDISLNGLPDSSVYIDQDGGSLTITDTLAPLYGTRIEIPPGAVNEGNIITISSVDSFPTIGDEFDEHFGPVINFTSSIDSVFNDSLLITMPINIIDTSEFQVTIPVYYDTQIEAWIPIPPTQIDIVENMINFKTDHFTLFTTILLSVHPDILVQLTQLSDARIELLSLISEINSELRYNIILNSLSTLRYLENTLYEELELYADGFEFCDEYCNVFNTMQKFRTVISDAIIGWGLTKIIVFAGGSATWIQVPLAIASIPCIVCYLSFSELNPQFWYTLGAYWNARMGIIIAEKALDEYCQETNTIIDIDGNIYQTVQIGNQWWMVENLRVTHYRNGDPIPNIIDNYEWINLTSGACCAYENNDSNSENYGLLYNLYAVSDGRGICPDGWHIPSDQDWMDLEMFLGMSQEEANNTWYRGTTEGGKLKEIGTIHWNSPNSGATNESGFSALPSGFRHNSHGAFQSLGQNGFWWTSSIYNENNNWGRALHCNESRIFRLNYSNTFGFSVRCVKD